MDQSQSSLRRTVETPLRIAWRTVAQIAEEAEAAAVRNGGATATKPEPHDATAVDEGEAVVSRIDIDIEVTVADLPKSKRAALDYVEFLGENADAYYDVPNPEGIDPAHTIEALRVTFHGWYDPKEDDFEGRTCFASSLMNVGTPVPGAFGYMIVGQRGDR